jgi:lipopolysaccharide biosynthesis glycosyltransferase
MMPRVYIGWDLRETLEYAVAVYSMRKESSIELDVRRISMVDLQRTGDYTRPTLEMSEGQWWDELSEAPMSTGHAIARFFIPHLCEYEGWALFTDGDILVRADVKDLFALADDDKAIMVVQHPPMPEQEIKKAGQVQTQYPRKNWSSVILFNCGHPANRFLSLDLLNRWPGRDLHAFKWLKDDQIGKLPAGWNYLVNVTRPVPDPVCLAHYTLGAPNMPFAEEWWSVAKIARRTQIYRDEALT